MPTVPARSTHGPAKRPVQPAATPKHTAHGTSIGHAGPQPLDGSGDVLLPHDRDEAVGTTDGIPSRPIQQAHRDLQRGLRDTDRGAVTDGVYRRLKEEAGPGDPSGSTDARDARKHHADASHEGGVYGRGR